MRNPLNIATNLDAVARASRETAAREKEVQEFDLAQIGVFMNGLKVLLFVVLGALNVRLFLSFVPGAWGYVIGGTAAMFEAFAVYCWFKMRKAGGEYQQWLFNIAITFTIISIVHACASFYDLVRATAGWPSIARPLYIYSHVFAFPLLFLGMIVALCILYQKHWSREIADTYAKVAVAAAKKRGEVLTEAAEMRAADEIARARLASYQERLQIEKGFLDLLQDVVTFETRASGLLQQIPDPVIRQRMADLIGRDLDQNGKPDILEDPALQAEARTLLNSIRPPQPRRSN